MTDPVRSTSRARPITAGIVTALVGFTSSFAVVLTGLRAVGATPEQAASGLLALCVTMGVACIVLAWRYRMPVTAAWSTPGAALLAATGLVEGGWPAAVGAFLVVAALILLTGLWPQLGRLIARIPPSIAQAMLAGVLLPLCLAPITGIVVNPWGVVPVVLTWLVFARLAPRWAVPLAFVAAAIVVGVSLAQEGAPSIPPLLVPRVELTMPTLTIGSVVGIAIPLFIVTMASQNVPGVAIMRSFGYEVPWRPAMLVTGHRHGARRTGRRPRDQPRRDQRRARRGARGGARPAAPLGRRRVDGGVLLVLGAASAAFAALVLLAPEAVIPAVAGLALFRAFGSAVQQAIDDPGERLPAVVTFLVAASGVAIAGVSAAFWALVAGLVVRSVLHPGRRRGAAG